jgi:hypothetical protein
MTTRFQYLRTTLWTACLASILTFGSIGSSAAQTTAARTPAPAAGTPAGQPPPASNLDDVKAGLQRESGLNLDDERLRFYTNVTVKLPMTFADYVKGYDLWHGPTKGGNPMTHQEFINMVTPRELYGSGGITASEILQFSFTNWLGQMLLRRGMEELKEAKTEKEAREIRERIDRELRALRSYEGN